MFAEGEWQDDGKPVRWVLAVEVKITAPEGEGQLAKYGKWLDSYAHKRQVDHVIRSYPSNRLAMQESTYARKRQVDHVIRVLLTPDGRTGESGADGWQPLSFLELVRVFRNVYEELRDAPGFHFLRFYLAGVLQDVCRWRPEDQGRCRRPVLRRLVSEGLPRLSLRGQAP